MRYLLDTCAFLWSIGDSLDLSDGARSVIEKGEDIFLSQASFWEIAIKRSIGKLELSESISELEGYCEDAGIIVLPIENRYFDTIQKLPYIHGDPFDRIIISTAIDKRLAILTTDKYIKQYKEVETFW